jgi:hypothetical protein
MCEGGSEASDRFLQDNTGILHGCIALFMPLDSLFCLPYPRAIAVCSAVTDAVARRQSLGCILPPRLISRNVVELNSERQLRLGLRE